MITKKDVVVLLVCFFVSGILIFLPTGFEGALQFKDAEKCKVLVEEADNSRLIDTGLIRSGQQVCMVTKLVTSRNTTFTVLASGEFNHYESGENRQF